MCNVDGLFPSLGIGTPILNGILNANSYAKAKEETQAQIDKINANIEKIKSGADAKAQKIESYQTTIKQKTPATKKQTTGIVQTGASTSSPVASSVGLNLGGY